MFPGNLHNKFHENEFSEMNISNLIMFVLPTPSYPKERIDVLAAAFTLSLLQANHN